MTGTPLPYAHDSDITQPGRSAETVLVLGGGNTAFTHPNVIDVEFNLYTNTDVVADAHQMPFKSGTFDQFFAMLDPSWEER